ncbi:MAG TPA: MBL fold metallo-hydrolase, partial [Candidatus Paceibacterota bacterium]
YSLEIEGIRLCHLGDFGEKSLRPEVKEKIGEVDILFLPIGGETVLDPQTAAKVSSQIEPKIIIPMHYGESAKGRNPLNEFVKEFGGEDIKPADKLTIKKRDIAQKEETELVILAPCLS